MAESKVQTAESSDALLKMGSFWNKYSKQILIALGVVVVAILGWYAYESMVVQPKEEEAAKAAGGAPAAEGGKPAEKPATAEKPAEAAPAPAAS